MRHYGSVVQWLTASGSLVRCQWRAGFTWLCDRSEAFGPLFW